MRDCVRVCMGTRGLAPWYLPQILLVASWFCILLGGFWCFPGCLLGFGGWMAIWLLAWCFLGVFTGFLAGFGGSFTSFCSEFVLGSFGLVLGCG